MRTFFTIIFTALYILAIKFAYPGGSGRLATILYILILFGAYWLIHKNFEDGEPPVKEVEPVLKDGTMLWHELLHMPLIVRPKELSEAYGGPGYKENEISISMAEWEIEQGSARIMETGFESIGKTI